MSNSTQPHSVLSTVKTGAGFAESFQEQACGKAIVVGEHAVVYGSLAVALPIKTHAMKLTLTKEATSSDETPSIRFLLGERPVPQHVSDVIHDALKILQVSPFSMTVRGKTSLPIGAGLGSSATLCVVILKALAQALDLTLTKADLAKLANQLEERFHGKPSGLDTAVIAHEEVIAFRKGREPRPIPVRGRWSFALVDSGLRASTLAMIRQAAPYFTNAESTRRIHQFDELANQVISGLEGDDKLMVGNAMRASNAMLAQAGVVTSELADMIVRCNSLGVVAAKITGAGGGGAILTLLKPGEEQPQLQELIIQFGENKIYKLEL